MADNNRGCNSLEKVMINKPVLTHKQQSALNQVLAEAKDRIKYLQTYYSEECNFSATTIARTLDVVKLGLVVLGESVPAAIAPGDPNCITVAFHDFETGRRVDFDVVDDGQQFVAYFQDEHDKAEHLKFSDSGNVSVFLRKMIEGYLSGSKGRPAQRESGHSLPLAA